MSVAIAFTNDDGKGLKSISVISTNKRRRPSRAYAYTSRLLQCSEAERTTKFTEGHGDVDI